MSPELAQNAIFVLFGTAVFLMLAAAYLAIANRNSDNLSILTNIPRIDIDLPNDELAFGLVKSNTTKQLTLQVDNAGGLNPLEISEISSSSADFSADPTSASIVAGDSREITITFTPSAVQHYDDSLTINSNDPDEPVMMAYLTGTGYPRIVAVTPGVNSSAGLAEGTISASFNAVMEAAARGMMIAHVPEIPIESFADLVIYFNEN